MGSFEKLNEDEPDGLAKKVDIEELTIDEAVDRIWNGINLKIILVFITAAASSYVTGAETYITVFTGLVPYNEWVCVSENCTELLAASNNSDAFYSKKSMCDNNLVAGTDFNWTSKRTSFSMDWGFYCSSEKKLSVASSFFFIGAFLGLLSSTAIFDRIGRRNGAIVGSVIAAVGTVAGTWIPTFEGMLAIRVLQGYGQFINFTAVYCWMIEFAPTHLRNAISAIILVCWSMGYLVMVLVGYLIPVWNYIFLATGILNFLLIIPLLIYPSSPRFSLVRGREKEAKRTLQLLGKVCNNEISFDTVKLTYSSRKQNFLAQLQDFRTFPAMRKVTLLCMVGWFVCAALFYGFSYGWSKISSNLYISYLFDALGKVIAFTLIIPVCSLFGRKKAMFFFLFCGILSNFLAMPDVKFSENWSLEYVACLLGSMVISSAFGLIYLYTSELAPTSHRGMIMSLSSSSARIGSFIGTYINLLYDITDRRVPLGVIAGASLVCGAAIFFLDDTTGRRIPETPQDVEELSRGEKYRAVKEGGDGL